MRRSIETAAMLGLFATLLPAQETPPQQTPPQEQPTKTARPSPDARAALTKAAQIRKQATGTRGEERTRILGAAMAAYEKILTDFASERGVAASSSFAVAELARSMVDLDKAKQFYARSIELDKARYAARSSLELAHLARRGKDMATAMALYQKVAKLQPTSARAHSARVWIGRCHVAAKKTDQAITAYRAAIDKAATPTQAIEACNRLAMLMVKQNQLTEAEKVVAIAAAKSKTAPTAKGQAGARQTKSWTNAYARMSARRALQRARDKASKAHADAVDVEKAKSKAGDKRN